MSVLQVIFFLLLLLGIAFLLQWVWRKLSRYVTKKKYQYHFLRLIGFSKKDYTTFKTVSISKIRNQDNWYFNNMRFPLLVILSPLALVAVHHFFKTIGYDKTVVEVLMSGSLTLLGINVLRTASTTMTEKVIIPDKSQGDLTKYDKLVIEIEEIRSKLERRTWVLTFAGWLLYFAQVGQFMNTSHWVIYVILGIIVVLTFVSIIYGRFIFIMKSNVLQDEEVSKLLFGSLLTQNNAYEDLKSLLDQQGVL